MSLTVTVRDNESGEIQTARVQDDDYLLLVTGNCRLVNTQVYSGQGTHVLTIKGQRAWPSAAAPDGVQQMLKGEGA
jgi:hypothetical protein